VRAAFIVKANRVCEKGAEERSAAIERVQESMAGESPALSPAAQQKRIGREAVLPQEAKMVAQLSDLDPPAADEEIFDEILKLYEKGLTELKADPRSSFTTISKSGVDQKATEYGLSEECLI
jgi:hypothetical protein